MESSDHKEEGAELRQRKTHLKKSKRGSSTVEALTNAVAKKMPNQLRPIVTKIGPLLNAATELYTNGKPYFNKVREIARVAYAKLKPYHPDEWIPIIVGLTLCFFGGCFATTIAAVEAFRAGGYYMAKEHLTAIYDDQKKVVDAWMKDDKKDDNHDGIADVLEMSEDELARHKFLLIVRTVDPGRLGKALTGLNTGILAVLAALQIRFAKAITLGSALGRTLYKVLEPNVVNDIEKKTHPDYRKWVKPVANYGCKFLGFMLSMTIWRVIMAFHSATTGAQMACVALLHYLARHQYVKNVDPANVKATKEFVIASTALGIFGFYWQFRHGFSIPFPLNVLLLPVTMIESILGFFVTRA